MPYAITQGCCSDASCVAVCPVDCIHPTPDEPDFGLTEMLFVDARACIDCGACADACPVDAIHPTRVLDPLDASLNAAFYDERPEATTSRPAFPPSLPQGFGPLRVAIVGSGPSAWYTADLLVRSAGAEVTMLDRAPRAGGLARYGVAPDHPGTRQVADRFPGLRRHPRFRLSLGVEVGRDISVADLAAGHQAVVYATGAAGSRSLGIPGEELPGSLPASDVVAWYNGHPDAAGRAVELAGERAVVIGNGNVALDVARVLLADPESLAATEIDPSALETLRHSGIREVVLVGRRGPAAASFTPAEFRALTALPGVDVVLDDRTGPLGTGPKEQLLAGLPRFAFDGSGAPAAGRRIVLRFEATPERIVGSERAEGVAFADGVVVAGLVVRAIGSRGVGIPGLPFDEATGTIPHTAGRVDGQPAGAAGTAYVVGWAKRGPTGGIGVNRTDAAETVRTLLADAAAGRLGAPRARTWHDLLRRGLARR